MRILVLGGTLFLGRAVVDDALERGWNVTLFNRGRTDPDAFPVVESIRGDRRDGLAPLGNRSWDVVIDTCGYVPRIVRDSADYLSGAAGRYVFVSTLNVYANPDRKGLSETDEVGVLEDESIEEVNGETYGPLKALCEKAVEETFSGKTLIIRPGLIVGPRDPSDRFTYWPCRVARNEKILAPAPPDSPVQFIDARDLASWMLDLAAGDAGGAFNAVGPAEKLTMARLLESCCKEAGTEPDMAWVDEKFLLERGVKPYLDLPLWVPAVSPGGRGFNSFDIRKAVAAGLRFRPLSATIRDTLAWKKEQDVEPKLRCGLAPEREKELLDEWFNSADKNDSGAP